VAVILNAQGQVEDGIVVVNVQDVGKLIQIVIELKILSYPHFFFVYNVGNIYRYCQNYKRAVECYEKIIELTPDDADAYNIYRTYLL